MKPCQAVRATPNQCKPATGRAVGLSLPSRPRFSSSKCLNRRTPNPTPSLVLSRQDRLLCFQQRISTHRLKLPFSSHSGEDDARRSSLPPRKQLCRPPRLDSVLHGSLSFLQTVSARSHKVSHVCVCYPGNVYILCRLGVLGWVSGTSWRYVSGLPYKVLKLD